MTTSASLFLLTAAAPAANNQEGNHCEEEDDSDGINARKKMEQMPPASAQKISNAAHCDGPENGSCGVKEHEAGNRHAINAGNNPNEFPQTGDETRHKNNPAALLQEDRLGAFISARGNKESFLEPLQNRLPAPAPDLVSNRFTRNRSGDGGQHGPEKVQLAPPGEKSGKKQGRLAGNGDAHILKKGGNKYSPVPVAAEEIGENDEQMMSHSGKHSADGTNLSAVQGHGKL